MNISKKNALANLPIDPELDLNKQKIDSAFGLWNSIGHEYSLRHVSEPWLDQKLLDVLNLCVITFIVVTRYQNKETEFFPQT